MSDQDLYREILDLIDRVRESSEFRSARKSNCPTAQHVVKQIVKQIDTIENELVMRQRFEQYSRWKAVA